MAKNIHFDGPCPFLTCPEKGPHDHPVCPKCGAVRYGNLFCDECAKQMEKPHPLYSVHFEKFGQVNNG